MIAAQAFGDVARWQSALAANAGVFASLAPGSRIGLVAEGAVNGAGTGAQMLLWQATGGGLEVRLGHFPGFDQTDVDILIAADDAALGVLVESLDGDVLAGMRRLIRDGHMLFFARKTRRDLEDAGYEDLLDQLGFAFLGACR